jgi:hypothetical protein
MTKSRTASIAIILAISVIIIIGMQPVHADGTNKINILNLKVSPAIIRVGDEFAINATLVNNSTDTITVHNGCGGPLAVVFDNHATVNVKKICNWMAIQIILKPGENITVTSLASNLAYNASSSGTVNANVTVSYDASSQSLETPNSSMVSRSLMFTIHDKNNQTNVNQLPILSPLEQLRSGVVASNIQCKQGLELIFKVANDSPVCVKPLTATKLVLWGWAKSTGDVNIVQDAPTMKTITLEDNGKSIDIKKGERFLLKLGSTWNWNVQIDNQTVASRVVNIMVVKDAQGVYEVHNAGNATITGVGDPWCHTSSPPCEIHSILFKANIIVSQ